MLKIIVQAQSATVKFLLIKPLNRLLVYWKRQVCLPRTVFLYKTLIQGWLLSERTGEYSFGLVCDLYFSVYGVSHATSAKTVVNIYNP